MKILITGSKGFVGKNLVATLNTIKEEKNRTTDLQADLEICEFDIDTDKSLLDEYCNGCDFVVNLFAGFVYVLVTAVKKGNAHRDGADVEVFVLNH